MPGAFLHKKSLLDQFGDDYKMVNPIKARRTERQWENPIIRRQREKGIQDWASSFAGKRHYRKLARFNAMRSEAFNAKEYDKFYDEVLDALYAVYDDGTVETIIDSYPIVDMYDKGMSTEEILEDIKGWMKAQMGEAKGEAYGGARFGKRDIVQALAGALHNDEDDNYSIRYFDSDKVGIEPSYAYAENKEGYDAWYVYDDGTVEFEFDGEPQGKAKVDSLSKLESTILKLFGLQLGGSGGAQEAKQAKRIYPKFVQISTQRDFDKYIKPALGRGTSAYGLSDIEGMWWEIADGERVPASAKTVREIRDSVSKRPRFIFISGAGVERGITDMSLTEYAREMGMTAKDYLDGYDAGSWESKKSETLEYEKGYKNSRGEDAPWVIRDHEGGKVLASFAKKADAEAHLERMKHYSKSESLKKALHESRTKKLERMGAVC